MDEVLQGFNLVDVTITPGRTGFSGSVIDIGDDTTGSIEGRLTGPQANEFIARVVIGTAGAYRVALWAGATQ